MADFTSPLTYGISSKVQSDNQFSVKSVITNHWQDSANTDHTTNKDFNVALVGVVAHVDGYVDQHVLTVAVGNDPFVLPAYQGTDVSFVFGITQAYSASQNVTIKMDGSAYALATDLDDVKNLQGSIGIAIDSKLKDYAKKDEVQNLIPDDIATTKNLADGDAETLKSAKEYADTKVSGKADDSAVVHTADMRKPANQVASIDEVNAKQDKIGYTPANDSKVVHDNHDGRISANGASILPANEDVIGRIDGAYTDMNDIPMGWMYLNGWAASGLSNWGLPQDFYYVHCFKTNTGYGVSTNIQIAYGVKLNNTYVRTMSATNWTPWKLLADDSKVVHLTDMRKPANQVASIDEVNAKQDKLDYTPANDADAFHRSPDTGAVTESGNFPALQVKGVDVATTADLKSVWLTMWHEIEMPNSMNGTPILMRYSPDDKTTMITGAKNGDIADGNSWEGSLLKLPEGFHWTSTDDKAIPLMNVSHHNDSVSGRLYNTTLSRNGSSTTGSTFGVWFTSLSNSIVNIVVPYTTVSSIQPD